MPVPLFTSRLRSGQMMDALGIDVAALRQRAIMKDVDLEDIARKCAGCAEAADCDRRLAGGSIRRTGAPDYCRNRDLFAVLTA